MGIPKTELDRGGVIFGLGCIVTLGRRSKKKLKLKNMHKHGGDAVYGLGLIGAAVYYISTAPSFWLGVLGFLKALVWPAFLVFEGLKFFGA